MEHAMDASIHPWKASIIILGQADKQTMPVSDGGQVKVRCMNAGAYSSFFEYSSGFLVTEGTLVLPVIIWMGKAISQPASQPEQAGHEDESKSQHWQGCCVKYYWKVGDQQLVLCLTASQSTLQSEFSLVACV